MSAHKLQPGLQPGRVVASYGRHFLVENAAGERLICHPRGKKSQAVVGDQVLWQASEDEGTIERLEPRRNLFYRQDEIRTKSFAANLDQVLVLIAAEPEFSESQLTRVDRGRSRTHHPTGRDCTKAPLPLRQNPPRQITWHSEDDTSAFARQLAAQPLLANDLPDPARRPWARAKPRWCCHLLRALGVEHVDQPAGARRLGTDRRNFTGAELGQTHHHQYPLVLDGCSAHHSADRLARIPGIRAAPHRADATGRLHARLQGARGQLPLLQLHPPPGTRLRSDRPCGQRRRRWPHQRIALPDIQRVVCRAVADPLLSLRSSVNRSSGPG